MKAIRIVSAAGVLGIAGLIAQPISSSAATGVGAATGSAQSSALSLQVSPQALLAINPELGKVLKALPAVGDVLSSGDLTVTLDGSNAMGALTADGRDVASGHADSTALAVNFAPLNTLLSKLKVVLDGLTTVDNTVFTALPQSLQDELTLLHINFDQPLEKLLQSIGVHVNSTIGADLNQANVANHPQSVENFISVPRPLQLTIAPFHANAVDGALAKQYNVAGGPQVSADNTTTALSVNGAPLTTAGIDLSGLITSLTNLRADLQKVLATANTVVTKGVAAVQKVLAGTPLAGLGSTLKTVTQTVVKNGTQTVEQVVDTAPLQALLDKLDKLILGLPVLNAAAANLNLGQLVQTSGVTSTALFHPTATGVEAVASTKVADIAVLPVNAQLGSLLRVPAGTALIHLVGVSSSSASALGDNTAGQKPSSSLGQLYVLGRKVLDANTLLSIPEGAQQSLHINIAGVANLNVTISRGIGVQSYDLSDHRATSISALDVRITTADSSANAFLPVSLDHAAPAGTQIADLAVAIARTEVMGRNVVRVGNPPVNQTVTPPTAGSPNQPSLPKTGMFGPLGLVMAGGLGAVAITLRGVNSIVSRRRRVR